MDAPLVPAHGVGVLADVVPSLLSGLGVVGFADRLRLNPARAVCLLLVDGLGWQALRAHPEDAPFLTSLTGDGEPITAGFPATTATSVATVGTGLPAGQHGIVGFSFATPDGSLINALNWCTHGESAGADLRDRFVPEVSMKRPAPVSAGSHLACVVDRPTLVGACNRVGTEPQAEGSRPWGPVWHRRG